MRRQLQGCYASMVDLHIIVFLLAFLPSCSLSDSQTVASEVACFNGLVMVQVGVHTLARDRAKQTFSNPSDQSAVAAAAGRNDENFTRVTRGSYNVRKLHQKAAKRHAEPGNEKERSEGKSKVDKESSIVEKPSDEEGDEEETRAESAISVAIAATLLGAIAGVLSLSYLLNHRDNDIKQAAYEVLSTTISILCAILVFQAFNEIVLMLFVSPDSGAAWLVAISVAQLLSWHCTAELALAYATGAIGRTPPTTSIGEITCRTKCYAVLLAHITGFAAINASCSIQQSYFSRTPLASASAVILCFIFLRCLQRVSDVCRRKIEELDDKVDDFEELWSEETKEAENDVMSFALSFTLIQVMRFDIGGVLPNLGEEEPATLFYHSALESYALLGVGSGFFVITFCGFYWLAHLDWYFKRTTSEIIGTCGMCFAWCVFYGVQWRIGPLAPQAFEENYVLLAILTALMCSVFAFLFIFALDGICDIFEHFSQQAQGFVSSCPVIEKSKAVNSLRKLLTVLGFLVGVAWEQAFDLAEESLANATAYPSASKFIFALISVFVLIPAWRWYILPMVHQEGWKYGFVCEHIVDNLGHEGAQQVIDDLRQAIKKQSLLGKIASSGDTGIKGS